MPAYIFCSCFLDLPGPSLNIYYFHLGVECYCAHPILWFRGSDITQFIMGSSGHIAIWCFSVSYSILTRANLELLSKWEIMFDKRRHGLPPKLRGYKLWFSYEGLSKIPIAFLSATDPSVITESTHSWGANYKVSYRASWICCSAFSQDPLKTSKLAKNRYLSKGDTQITSNHIEDAQHY